MVVVGRIFVRLQCPLPVGPRATCLKKTSSCSYHLGGSPPADTLSPTPTSTTTRSRNHRRRNRGLIIIVHGIGPVNRVAFVRIVRRHCRRRRRRVVVAYFIVIIILIIPIIINSTTKEHYILFF